MKSCKHVNTQKYNCLALGQTTEYFLSRSLLIKDKVVKRAVKFQMVHDSVRVFNASFAFKAGKERFRYREDIQWLNRSSFLVCL